MSVGEQASEQVMIWASISVHVFVQRSIWQKYEKRDSMAKQKSLTFQRIFLSRADKLWYKVNEFFGLK